MFKAPAGRVETIDKALAHDLRNLPMPEPSERIAGALSRAVEDVARLLKAEEERPASSCQMMKSRRS